VEIQPTNHNSGTSFRDDLFPSSFPHYDIGSLMIFSPVCFGLHSPRQNALVISKNVKTSFARIDYPAFLPCGIPKLRKEVEYVLHFLEIQDILVTCRLLSMTLLHLLSLFLHDFIASLKFICHHNCSPLFPGSRRGGWLFYVHR
jgi:hypothetical protein